MSHQGASPLVLLLVLRRVLLLSQQILLVLQLVVPQVTKYDFGRPAGTERDLLVYVFVADHVRVRVFGDLLAFSRGRCSQKGGLMLSGNGLRAALQVGALWDWHEESSAGPALVGRDRGLSDCLSFEGLGVARAHGACVDLDWFRVLSWMLVVVIIVVVYVLHLLYFIEDLYGSFHQFFKFVLPLFIEEARLLLHYKLSCLGADGASPDILRLSVSNIPAPTTRD